MSLQHSTKLGALSALFMLAASSTFATPGAAGNGGSGGVGQPAPPPPPASPAPVAAFCNGANGAAPLARTDVTFNTVKADDCYGVVDLPNQDPGTISGFINDLDGSGPSLSGLWTPNPWTFIARDDVTGGNSGSKSYGGYGFTITADNSANGVPTPSDWTLTVTGTPIPFLMDFVVYLHAGSNSAYYLFDEREIGDTNNGAFSIKFTAGNGNSTSNPGLSGLTILGRDIRTIDLGCTANCNASPVPEPASLALVGLAMAALGWSRRRHSRPR